MTKYTPAIYGAAPVDLGEFKLDTSEMMFWLYLPIKMPGRGIVLPKQLDKFYPLVEACFADVVGLGKWRWFDSYVYLSVKITHVTPDAPRQPSWLAQRRLPDGGPELHLGRSQPDRVLRERSGPLRCTFGP